MTIDDERYWMYDTRNGVDRLSAIGGRVEDWMPCGGHGAVLCRNMEHVVDMPFMYCTKEEAYVSRLELIVQKDLDLANTVQVTHRL